MRSRFVLQGAHPDWDEGRNVGQCAVPDLAGVRPQPAERWNTCATARRRSRCVWVAVSLGCLVTLFSKVLLFPRASSSRAAVQWLQRIGAPAVRCRMSHSTKEGPLRSSKCA